MSTIHSALETTAVCSMLQQLSELMLLSISQTHIHTKRLYNFHAGFIILAVYVLKYIYFGTCVWVKSRGNEFAS